MNEGIAGKGRVASRIDRFHMDCLQFNGISGPFRTSDQSSNVCRGSGANLATRNEVSDVRVVVGHQEIRTVCAGVDGDIWWWGSNMDWSMLGQKRPCLAGKVISWIREHHARPMLEDDPGPARPYVQPPELDRVVTWHQAGSRAKCIRRWSRSASTAPYNRNSRGSEITR